MSHQLIEAALQVMGTMHLLRAPDLFWVETVLCPEIFLMHQAAVLFVMFIEEPHKFPDKPGEEFREWFAQLGFMPTDSNSKLGVVVGTCMLITETNQMTQRKSNPIPRWVHV